MHRFNQLGNPRTMEAALVWLETAVFSKTLFRRRMSTRLMAQAYGWPSSRAASALHLWDTIPPAYKKTGRKSIPPKGALVFWDVSSHRYGNVAISAGKGDVFTQHLNGALVVRSLSYMDSRAKRLGWTAPLFPANLARYQPSQTRRPLP